jgi:hypothetical protein
MILENKNLCDRRTDRQYFPITCLHYAQSKEGCYLNIISSLQNIIQLSKKSGTNGNFNYFSYFYLQVKVKG